MNPRSTWILVALSVAFGGWVFLTDPRNRPGPAVEVKGWNEFDPASVVAVEFLRTNAVLRAERSDQVWRLTYPVRYAAQAPAIEAFVKAVATLRPRSHLTGSQLEATEGGSGLAAFGLGDNATTLKLELDSGPPVLLRIGGLTPLGGQFYFQRVGADGVFTADQDFLGMVPRTPDHWRDRGLFDRDSTVYDRLEVRGKPAFTAVRQTGSGEWQLIRPLTARADGARIEALLQALRNVRVAGFVTDSPQTDLEILGLQPPDAELILGVGTNDRVRLQFGGPVPDAPEHVFVRRLATTNVVLVPAEAAQLLKLPLANFRDRRLVPSLAEWNRLQIRAGGEVTVIERRNGIWTVTEPENFPADPPLIEQLQKQLLSLPIVDFPNDVPADLARYGLDRPVREIVVGAGTNELVRLDFGSDDGRDVFVKRADEPSVYSVPLAELLRLPETAAQFRRLAFEGTNVVQVEIQKGGRSRTLSRGPDGRWLLPEGAQSPLVDEVLQETLYRMGRLESARFAIRDPRQYDLLKFTDVDHSVTLQFRPGSELRSVEFRFGGLNPLNDLYATMRFNGAGSPVLIEFPGVLYADVLRDFSVP